MLRRIGIAVTVLGAVMFVVGFLWLSITGGCPGDNDHTQGASVDGLIPDGSHYTVV